MNSLRAAMSGDEWGQWPADMSAALVEGVFGNEPSAAPEGAAGRGWPALTSETGYALPGLSGTMRVETPGGPKRLDALLSGEFILTRNRGYQQMNWRVETAPREVHPVLRSPVPMVRIAAGALGRSYPAHDVVVASSQRIMLADPRAEALFGAREVLVEADHLVHLDGVERVDSEAQAHVSLLFDTHEIILVDGLWTESLLPEPELLDALPADERSALRAAHPRLWHATGRAAYVPARMVLNAREARLLSGL